MPHVTLILIPPGAASFDDDVFTVEWAKLGLAKPKRFDPGNYEPSVARSFPLTAN